MTTFSSAKNNVVYVSLFVIYVACVIVFSKLSAISDIVPLWPAAGAALVGCYIFGSRFIPAIILGYFVFELSKKGSLEHFSHISNVANVLIIGCGASLQAWLNYKLLAHRKINILESPSYRAAANFIIIALICSATSATIANIFINLLNLTNSEQVSIDLQNAILWWAGDFIGVVIAAPLLLSIIQYFNNTNKTNLLLGITLPFILILAAFEAAQHLSENWIIKNTERNLEVKAQAKENILRRQMANYTQAVNLLAQKMSANIGMNNKEFAETVKQITQGLSGIKAMSWNPIVDKQSVSEFELTAQREIDPTFKVKGPPIEPFDPLVIVKYIEPLVLNKAALGYNVFSNPERKKTILQAKRSQQATATNIIQLIQAADQEPGFLIFSPVLVTDGRQLLLKQQAQIEGFVVAVFLVKNIVEQSLNLQQEKLFSLYIYENDDYKNAVYGKQEIYHAVQAGLGKNHAFELSFANHHWTYILHIPETIVEALEISDYLTILLVKIIICTLFAFITLSSFARRESLKAMVADRTIELKQLNGKLESLAFYDVLTGLPNRRLFFDRATHAVNLAKRNENRLALFFIDIDNFKQINDSLGHDMGDKLLTDIVKRFSQVKRDSDTLARIGGDEFTLLVENNPNRQAVSIILDNLTSCLKQPIRLSNKELFISASIGIASYPQDGRTINELLKVADQAMYKEKKRMRIQTDIID